MFPSDCTYEQSKKVKDKGPYWCFYLSNATDRFPLDLQREILSGWFGKDKAAAWARIKADHEVLTPEGRTVKYMAGQP